MVEMLAFCKAGEMVVGTVPFAGYKSVDQLVAKMVEQWVDETDLKWVGMQAYLRAVHWAYRRDYDLVDLTVHDLVFQLVDAKVFQMVAQMVVPWARMWAGQSVGDKVDLKDDLSDF